MKKRLTAILTALSMLCSNAPAVYAAEAFTISEEQAGSGNGEAMISEGAEAPDVEGEIHVPDETAKTEEAEETATAQEQAAQSGVRSGVCGDDLNWTLNEVGVLRINGTGEMYDYEFFKSDPPWNLYGDEYYNNHSVKSLIISEGVTSIGNVAFSRCYALESVSIPSTLQKIGNSAFEECQKLKEVIFPNGLLSIGNDAFRKCTSLAGVNIPDSVTDYGQMVFGECSAMPFIRLGKNITGVTYNLRGNDFNDCTSLTSIQVSPENPSYTSVDGVLFNRSKTTLVSYPPARPGTHYTIPDTVHTIGYHAVSNCVNLTSVTVPDSVYAIDDGGFDGNEKLQHIDLGNGVRSMGIWALANCTSLESVTLPRKLQCVNYCLFAYDTALRKVFFTGSAPTFKSNAFRDVKASVYFPTNVGNGWTNEIMSPSYEGDLIWLPWNAPLTPIDGCTVTLAHESYIYDGAEKMPAVTVRLNDVTLKENTDFSVAYSNNRNVGIATVTVTGKGSYTGTVQKTFTIEEAPRTDIKDAAITLSQEKYTYDGAEKMPAVTVKLNGKTLKADVDYTVSYLDNIKAGMAKVIVTGKGNYTGAAQKTFTIQEAPKISIAKAVITLSQEKYTYDGTEKKPSVTVKLNGKTLEQNTDYTVAYSNNKNVGVAKATVTGKGSYTGTVTRTFSIVAKTKAFAWGKDNWNYNNSSAQKYFSSGQYINQINSTYLNKLKKSLTNSEYQAIFNKSRGWIYDRFGGSCYGMSSTALLAKRGYLPYTQYKSGASSLYQLNYPLADMKVSSLVTYYQMLQVKGVIQQQYRTLPTKSHKENIQKILSLLDSNPTVLVGFKKDGWGGHAVLAYGYDYGSFTWNGVSYQGRIKICDPNSSRRTSDNSQCHIYFNTKTYNWEIPYYSYASIKSSSGAKFNYAGASVNDINSGGYLSGTDKNGLSDYVARIDAAAIARNRTVIKMLEQNGVYIPNHAASDDIVEDYSYVLGSEGDGTIGYNLYDAESSYKVSQEDPVKLQLSLDYGDCFLEGGSMAGKSVIFDKDGYVSVAGESADFNIAMTFNEDYPTDWFTMTVSGKNSDEASLQKVEGGYILEGENLEKIEVEANNREDSVHASFSTSYPSAYICEIDENTVGVKVDKDNNGSYETLIAKGRGEKPQAPVSIEKAKISGIKTAYTYTGKKQTPKPVVKAAGKTLLNGTDYAVSYKNNQNVGIATVTIKGKGGFTGTQKITFKINPKKTSLKSLTKGKKQITVKWKKQTAQASGYEIQCSSNKNFTKNATTLTTVKKASAASTVIKNRKAKKKYFVRIRTYKIVSGKKYYSGWSAAKNVTTK